MEVEIGRSRFRRPRWIGFPCVRTSLECRCLPWKLFSLAVQPIAEPHRFDIFAKLHGSIVTAEVDQAEGLRFGSLPLSVAPWPMRSEEHTSELQSLAYLVCRLL